MAGSIILDGAIMNLIFVNANTGIGLGDGNGAIRAGTTGNVFVSLHTADPTRSGNQTSSEANYSGYARQPVVRTTSGWTFAAPGGNTWMANAGVITFPICTGGSSNVTYFGIGSDLTGTGNLYFSGALTSGFLNISNNITPSYAANTLIVYAT